MNLEDLNLISEKNLVEKGFRKRGCNMYKIIHDQEIRFVEIGPQVYAFDKVEYIARDREFYEDLREVQR